MTAFSDPQEDQREEYHALSTLALLGLALGLLSPLAFIDPGFWVVPLAGVVVCAWAWRRIAAEWPALTGRKMALVGLWLSLACGVAASVDWSFYRWTIRGEARQFAQAFFDYLRANEPQKAHQLTCEASGRWLFDEHLWNNYVSQWWPYHGLEKMVELPAVRALLALGDKAEVRYYDTETQGCKEEHHLLSQVYAVTIPGERGKTTFFLRLRLRRTPYSRAQESYWRVYGIEGGIQPVALGGVPPKAP